MKKLIAILLVLILSLSLCACGESSPSGTLKIYVDGSAFQDTSTLALAFEQQYPDIHVEIEELPQMKLNFYEDLSGYELDTDALTAREAALQQHRTAIMAGASDADLFVVGGGINQYHDENGGTLVQDPYDLVAAGVLADLSGVLDGIDRADYLADVFEEGSSDGTLYLVPLRVMTYGFGINMEKNPQFPAARDTFLQTLAKEYAAELAVDNYGMCSDAVFSLSYSVVDKRSQTISLYDENYITAIETAKTFCSLIQQNPVDNLSVWEEIQNGTIFASSNTPIVTFAVAGANLMGNDQYADLAFVPFPNEKDGVTAEVYLYAFAPAACKNLDAAELFLQWMLSQEVQNGTMQVYSGTYGYPVRKGCSENTLATCGTYVSDRVGQTAIESMTALENRVTDAKYSSHYDYELQQALIQWQSGEAELDTALEELYNDWSLYLDE